MEDKKELNKYFDEYSKIKQIYPNIHSDEEYLELKKQLKNRKYLHVFCVLLIVLLGLLVMAFIFSSFILGASVFLSFIVSTCIFASKGYEPQVIEIAKTDLSAPKKLLSREVIIKQINKEIRIVRIVSFVAFVIFLCVSIMCIWLLAIAVIALLLSIVFFFLDISNRNCIHKGEFCILKSSVAIKGYKESVDSASDYLLIFADVGAYKKLSISPASKEYLVANVGDEYYIVVSKEKALAIFREDGWELDRELVSYKNK